MLYLSGAVFKNSEQNDSRKSLGGYISTTKLPNGRINILFDDVTSYGKRKKKEEFVAIFFKNETGAKINNLIIRQFYQKKFNELDNEAKFEWAAVLSNDGCIEKIGSRFEMPYNADFFEPDCEREDCIVEITTAGASGDVVNMLGENILLNGNSIESNLFSIIDHFEDHPTYLVLPYSEDSFYVRRKAFLETNNPITPVSPGNLQINNVSFSGFNDNGFLIIDELEEGEIVGFWIKRSLSNKTKKTCKDLEKEFNEILGEDFTTDNLMDEDNEEELEVIFSWDNQ